MLYALSFMVMINAFATEVQPAPQTRFICAQFLGEGGGAGFNPRRYTAPFQVLARARRGLGEPAPALTLKEQWRRLWIEFNARASADVNLVIDDASAVAPHLSPTELAVRRTLFKRVHTRLVELLRRDTIAFERSHVVSGEQAVVDELSTALAGARAMDQAHAAELDARLTEATRAFDAANPKPRHAPLSRNQKIAASFAANAVLWLGAAALEPSHPAAAYAVGFTGVLAWVGWSSRIFDRLAGLTFDIKTWLFDRRLVNHFKPFNESHVARSRAHVNAIEKMIASARTKTDSLTYYTFEAELPLNSGSSAAVPLTAATIAAGAGQPATFSFRRARWAKIELVLTTRAGVPTLMIFAHEIINPTHHAMSVYESSLSAMAML